MLRFRCGVAFSIVFGFWLAGSSASGADQLIAGKRLLIRNPPSGATGNKVVHLGKDPSLRR
jgi:hypothetical protein